MTETPERPLNLSQAVGKQLYELRKQKRLTQEQLAQKVTELLKLDPPMHPTAILRMERDKRKVTLEELVALARALGVPPVTLVLPLGTARDVELLPGQPSPTWESLKWWIGEYPFVTREPGGHRLLTMDEVLNWKPGTETLQWYRDHDAAVRAAEDARRDGDTGEIERAEAKLRELRQYMRRAEVARPDLPDDLAHLENEGGEGG